MASRDARSITCHLAGDAPFRNSNQLTASRINPDAVSVPRAQPRRKGMAHSARMICKLGRLGKRLGGKPRRSIRRTRAKGRTPTSMAKLIDAELNRVEINRRSSTRGDPTFRSVFAMAAVGSIQAPAALSHPHHSNTL
jgi:hypothetical protein